MYLSLYKRGTDSKKNKEKKMKPLKDKEKTVNDQRSNNIQSIYAYLHRVIRGYEQIDVFQPGFPFIASRQDTVHTVAWHIPEERQEAVTTIRKETVDVPKRFPEKKKQNNDTMTVSFSKNHSMRWCC